MSQPPSEAVVCEGCGVTNARNALRCQNCGRLLPAGMAPGASVEPGQVVIRTEPPPEPLNPVPVGQFTLGSLMLLITLLSVCFALLAAAPGLGIFAAVASLPAFIRTSLLVRRREELGRPISATKKAVAFAASLGTVLVCTAVVIAASIGTFCGVCLVSFDVMRDASIPFALLSAVGATLVAVTLLIRWMRWRWKRDLKDL